MDVHSPTGARGHVLAGPRMSVGRAPRADDDCAVEAQARVLQDVLPVPDQRGSLSHLGVSEVSVSAGLPGSTAWGGFRPAATDAVARPPQDNSSKNTVKPATRPKTGVAARAVSV